MPLSPDSEEQKQMLVDVARAIAVGAPAHQPAPQGPPGAGPPQRPQQAVTDPIEVGSFSPTPGITVDRTGTQMHITGTLEATGPEANAVNAALAEATIRHYWNQVFPADGYLVVCDVWVRPPGTPSTGAAKIWMERITGPSHANKLTDTITLNMNESDALTWTVAHEFGHLLDLRDRYSESIISRLLGFFGGERTATVDPGYKGSIMGEQGGVMRPQTWRDLGMENAPDMLTDDDQVRLWVTRHSAAEIGALSTPTKIQMINTLLDGWVSDADISSIEMITTAVTSPLESTAVKRALSARVADLSHTGHRTQIRWIMDQMP